MTNRTTRHILNQILAATMVASRQDLKSPCDCLVCRQSGAAPQQASPETVPYDPAVAAQFLGLLNGPHLKMQGVVEVAAAIVSDAITAITEDLVKHGTAPMPVHGFFTIEAFGNKDVAAWVEYAQAQYTELPHSHPESHFLNASMDLGEWLDFVSMIQSVIAKKQRLLGQMNALGL